MDDDFLNTLGVAFLGSRLLRASELAREGSSEALLRAGYRASTRSVSTILLLRDKGAMGITEIAYRLKFSHPLIVRIARDLADAGLVRDLDDPKDSRRRIVTLTEAGVAQAKIAETFVRSVARVYRAIFDEAGVDLFAAVERFEGAVERESIAARLAAEFAGRQSPEKLNP